MRRFKPGWMMIAAALLAVGCANQKEPAEKAVAQIESAIAAIREQAQEYAPDALQGVESSLADLKEKLAKGDYKSVLADTPSLTGTVNSLSESVAARKEELVTAATAEWNSLSADIPRMVSAIQSRVDILGQSRKLPKNISQEAFDTAKAGLENMKAEWAQATASFDSGEAMDAVAKANSVRQTGMEVLQQLGMSAG